MPQIILPQKYYLNHFDELCQFINQTSLTLLDEAQLKRFHALFMLSEDARCLLVRLFSRRHQVFSIDSLSYQEIARIDLAIAELKRANWLRTPIEEDLFSWLQSLKKSQLQEIAQHFNKSELVKSAKKSQWLEYVQLAIPREALISSDFASCFIVLLAQQDFDYWQFLYFGSSAQQLNLFSLRDMGIMKTRDHAPGHLQPRFDDIRSAKTAFQLSMWSSQIKQVTGDELPHLAGDMIEWQSHIEQQNDDASIERYHHLLLRLAGKLEKDNHGLSKQCFALCKHPKAIEKKIRLHYSEGDHIRCQALLNDVLKDPPNEELAIFAEDFWLRKFNQKRTSVLTDLLRTSNQPIFIDEAFKNQVEEGVCEFLHRQHKQAFHVENQLWRTLFGLVFWQELYLNEKAGVFTEFQRTPSVLKRDCFYQTMELEIENRLQSLTSSLQWRNLLVDHASRFYEQPTNLFHWHSELLTPLLAFIEVVPLQQVKELLRRMAMRFHSLKDGFPDLLIINGCGEVSFMEVKAPGDVLRRNQLVSINSLIECGFNVSVQTVEWQIDPNQPYLVVDIETTGGKSQTDRITEIAIVKVQHGNIVDSWSSLVNPKRHIPKFITGLTGISNDMVQNAPTFTELADTIEEKLSEGIFVAHNVNFDYGFIKQSLLRLGRHLKRPKLCTVQLARKYIPGHASYSLGKLCAALDIDLTTHHRALADATATAHLLQLINEKREQLHDH
ncbi:DNA polymerase III epsilon subunit [Pseudoalteromonas luteoviolacea B = ATCC 29581]|nr:DNA polymerase III epsilon subunit [Pseudoalteromonas luteoviolacea B = ATCC 29581]